MDNSKVLCGKCNSNIPKNLRVIKCNLCSKFFHVKCCDVNHRSYNSLMQENQLWLCCDCKPTKKLEKGKCNNCRKRFVSNSKPVNCNLCNLSFHLKCVDISGYSTRQVRQSSWCCQKCSFKALPFNGLDKESTCIAIHGSHGVKEELINKPSFSIQSLLDEMPGQNFSPDDFLTDSISSRYYSPSEFLMSSFSDNFTMLHLNIASLSKHIDELNNLLKLLNFSFDIIGITETRLYDDQPLTNIEIDGYDFVHTPTSTKCGGAGIYIKSSYDYEIKSELSLSLPNVSESMFIEIKRKKLKNLLVGCVYRHHCQVSTFWDNYFQPTLDKINRFCNKTCAIMGDFNVNLINYASHSQTNEFYDLFSSYGFRPLILQPTRITSTTSTLIDNIFINDMSSHSIGGNITSSISDHFLQFCQIDIFKTEKEKPSIKFSRNYRDFDNPKFADELM